jgi:hypothetical protein
LVPGACETSWDRPPISIEAIRGSVVRFGATTYCTSPEAPVPAPSTIVNHVALVFALQPQADPRVETSIVPLPPIAGNASAGGATPVTAHGCSRIGGTSVSPPITTVDDSAVPKSTCIPSSRLASTSTVAVPSGTVAISS